MRFRCDYDPRLIDRITTNLRDSPSYSTPAHEQALYPSRMPSYLHEALLLLFRNRPGLAPELLRDALQVDLPPYTQARIESTDLTEIEPAEYRADLVVLLLNDTSVLGVIVEAQLSRDERKRFAWPVYVTNLRARLRCPVCLLVVTTNESVARWAGKPIELGAGNVFTPQVLHPSGIPEITDSDQALADPELAVLSSMAHGHDADTDKAVRIAFVAQSASESLDDDRSQLYLDLILSSLSEVARRALQAMNPAKYEYQSEFARKYFSQGIEKGVAQGRAEGRADLILRQLSKRFGPLTDEAQQRIAKASIDELDTIGERLLTAQTLHEAIGTSR